MIVEFSVKSYSRDVKPTTREILAYLEKHQNPSHFYIIDSWASQGGLACIRITEPVRHYLLANAEALCRYTDLIGISAFSIWTCNDYNLDSPHNQSLYGIKTFRVDKLIDRPDAAIGYFQDYIVELYNHQEEY